MDTIIFPKTPESDCNMACAGEKTQMCGGYCRISVYYVLRYGLNIISSLWGIEACMILYIVDGL